MRRFKMDKFSISPKPTLKAWKRHRLYYLPFLPYLIFSLKPNGVSGVSFPSYRVIKMEYLIIYEVMAVGIVQTNKGAIKILIWEIKRKCFGQI